MHAQYYTLAMIGIGVLVLGCQGKTYIAKGHGTVGSAGAGGMDGASSGNYAGPSSCLGAVPDAGAVTSATVLRSCEAVKQAYDVQVLNGGAWFWFAWGDHTPGAPDPTATVQPITDGPCGLTKALVLKSVGHSEQYGSGFGEYTQASGSSPKDLSSWDGVGLWVRAASGPGTACLLSVSDANSVGKIVDAATGEKTCYQPGDDWDHDGKPNATVPLDLSCSGWMFPLQPDGTWTYVAIPWGAWSQVNSNLAALGFDPTATGLLWITLARCESFELWIAEIDAYRSKP